MFGFTSISELPISDFPFVGVVPPPAPTVSTTDGFTPQEARRYQNLIKRLTNVSKARDRIRMADAKRIRQIVEDVVDPKPPVIESAKEEAPVRKTLSTKSLPDLNGEIYRLELIKAQMEYEQWRRMEYQRLQEVEREREQQRDDEEALLLLL